MQVWLSVVLLELVRSILLGCFDKSKSAPVKNEFGLPPKRRRRSRNRCCENPEAAASFQSPDLPTTGPALSPQIGRGLSSFPKGWGLSTLWYREVPVIS